MEIKIKLIDKECAPERHGDWIDLKAAKTVRYNKGDFVMIPLGVAMKLPKGHEGHLLPRSSTFRKYGVLLVNGTGIIDNAYCGNEDQWCFPALAMRDGVINKGERIAQFRVFKTMDSFLTFNVVEHLESPNRGGFGSTGV